jgi:hypothetical protein
MAPFAASISGRGVPAHDKISAARASSKSSVGYQDVEALEFWRRRRRRLFPGVAPANARANRLPGGTRHVMVFLSAGNKSPAFRTV